jgi:hypothetical protein
MIFPPSYGRRDTFIKYNNFSLFLRRQIKSRSSQFGISRLINEEVREKLKLKYEKPESQVLYKLR